MTDEAPHWAHLLGVQIHEQHTEVLRAINELNASLKLTNEAVRSLRQDILARATEAEDLRRDIDQLKAKLTNGKHLSVTPA